MMRLVLLVLVFLSIYSATTFGDKTEQGCMQSDFRSYTHCIRKRQTNAVNWCSAQGCTTCIGNSCQITCKGVSCGACPNGECCDGKNCNVCYNTNCCSTASCNYCISTCRHACSKQTVCQNNCIQQCQNDTNEVFIVPSKPQVPGDNEVVVYIKGAPHEGHVSSGKLPTSNRTAVVSVDGVQYPATILILSPFLSPSPCQLGQNQQIINQNFYNKLQNGCCHVVHPEQCYTNQVYPYRHCVRRSHQECSSLCSSKFVHLTPHHQNQCQYIKNYPYVYCGQHAAQKCDNCYVCNGQYNPSACVQRNECSNTCRNGFFPPDLSKLQRTIPNGQQSQPTKPCDAIQRPTGNEFSGPSQQLMQLPHPQYTQLGGGPFQYG